jgi:hypothetical protein
MVIEGETEVAQLDGADATDTEQGTVQFWNFNLDAIAEFKVLQANYSAEFGQGGGTITQIVTKSGTNQFHGSAYEFLRNSAFDASNYFSTSPPHFIEASLEQIWEGQYLKTNYSSKASMQVFARHWESQPLFPFPPRQNAQGW